MSIDKKADTISSEDLSSISLALGKYVGEIIGANNYNVIFIGLYGSQNYLLNNDKSDVDAKAIVVPSKEDLIYGKMVSQKITLDTGTCTISDVRSFFNSLAKGSPNDLELLFTDYYLALNGFSVYEPIDSNSDLLKRKSILDTDKRQSIVDNIRGNLLHSLYEVMVTDKKEMLRPRPVVKEKVEKYGYDGKAAYHVLRCAYLCRYFVEHQLVQQDSFQITDPVARETMLSIKNNQKTKDDVMDLTAAAIEEVQRMKSRDILSKFKNCNPDNVSRIGYDIVRRMCF